jgi:hypothetical protein
MSFPPPSALGHCSVSARVPSRPGDMNRRHCPRTSHLRTLVCYHHVSQSIWLIFLASPPTFPPPAVALPLISSCDSVPSSCPLPASTSQATVQPLASVSYNEAFANFQLQVKDADQLSLNSRKKLLGKAFSRCCPASSIDVWKYNNMVLRHVLDQGWYWGHVLKKQCTTATPPIHQPMFSELLDCLQILLSQAPGDLHLHELLKQLAQSALHAKHGRSSDLEDNASRLIRQLWQSALSRGTHKTDAIKKLLSGLASKIRSDHERGLLLNLISDPSKARTHIIYSVTRIVNTPDHFASAERALFCIPEKLLGDMAPKVTLHLAEAVRHKSSLSEHIYMERVNVWLRLVQNLESKTSSTLCLIDMALASLAKAVSDDRRSDRLRPKILTSAILLILAEQEGFRSEKASQFVQTYSPPFWDQSHTSFAKELEHLIIQLRKNSLSYDGLLRLSLPLVARHAELDLVLRCLNMLGKQRLQVPDLGLDTHIMDRMPNIRAQTSAKEVQHDAYALRMCDNILSALNQISPPPETEVHDLDLMQATRQFDHLTCRAQDSRSLPIVFRDLTRDMSAKQRVGLVHQLAHVYSLDTTRTHLQTYRSLTYLYRYLISNSYPIGPLFTKAVARTAITRPLSERHFVSRRRMRFVRRLVAKVEGNSEGIRLEERFWQRRGEVIQHAKSTLERLSGNTKERAHVSTMKRLGLL